MKGFARFIIMSSLSDHIADYSLGLLLLKFKWRKKKSTYETF